MKFSSFNFRNLRLAISLGLAFGFANAGWSKSSIQSISVSPNPMKVGREFVVSVSASEDTTHVLAVVSTRKAEPQLVQVPLVKQGSNWIGTNVLPLDLRFDDPHKPEARVRVVAMDAALRRAEELIRLPVDVPNISAVFSNGVLTVIGDEDDNIIMAGLNASNAIVINGGTVLITGGVPTMTNTTLIRILGMEGHDTIQVDGGSSMPASELIGGEGDDTLFGSNGPDTMDGGPGNDTLTGRAGEDTLKGGTGHDTLNGGQSVDQLIGGEGDDQFVWNPGDSSDFIEGEAGDDTLMFNGSNIGEIIDLSRSTNGTRMLFFRNVGNVIMDCGTLERANIRSLGGTDNIVVNDITGTEVTHVVVDHSTAGVGEGQPDFVFVNGTATNDMLFVHGATNDVNVSGIGAVVTIVGIEPAIDELLVNGQAGLDLIDASALKAGAILLTLNGGFDADKLVGSQGDDLLIGGRDMDELHGGPGHDTIEWGPGDSNDVVEGDQGTDTLLFRGSNASEMVNVTANGDRVTFTRNVANITMDCHGVETIRYDALGGTDVITVDDLTGTDVSNVYLALQGSFGTNDLQADMVTVFGTANNDTAVIHGTSAGVVVQGLSATVTLVGSESIDQLAIRLLAGDDSAVASELAAGLFSLILDGGLNNDSLFGSPGADVLLGDEGDDILVGGPGLDVLDGGNGNNVLIQD